VRPTFATPLNPGFAVVGSTSFDMVVGTQLLKTAKTPCISFLIQILFSFPEVEFCAAFSIPFCTSISPSASHVSREARRSVQAGRSFSPLVYTGEGSDWRVYRMVLIGAGHFQLATDISLENGNQNGTPD